MLEVAKMSDYDKLYFKMVQASEQAINILITAQRECEELYISLSEATADTKIEPDIIKNNSAYQ